MRVLHVTEAMGAGIVSSILAMVEATPDVDHHLYARPRSEHDTGDDLAEHFTSVHLMPGNPLKAVRELRKLERDLFPDVVHAHSSFGGVLARMSGLDRPRIVYSPHCFAFERRDISGLQRRLFEHAERTLASRTDLFMAVAPNEMDLAAELGHTDIAYTANRTLLSTTARASYAEPMRIVTAGRISPQKDWRYFLHVKRYAEQELGVKARWEWLGGGDAKGEHALAEAGVSVSGWIPREEILERMAGSQAYLHTAAWEAAPISILEAAALGLPLVGRAIAPLESLGVPGMDRSVARIGARIASLMDAEAWAGAQHESDEFTQRHTKAIQGRQLRDAYSRVLGRDAAGAHLTPLPAPAKRESFDVHLDRILAEGLVDEEAQRASQR